MYQTIKSLNDVNALTNMICELKKRDGNKNIDRYKTIGIANAMLSEFIHNNIIIKPSPIHGKGVFATKDIPKNTTVTLYPPHAIKINGNMIYTNIHLWFSIIIH